MDTKIVAGKTYQTRNGLEAECIPTSVKKGINYRMPLKIIQGIEKMLFLSLLFVLDIDTENPIKRKIKINIMYGLFVLLLTITIIFI